MAGIFEELAQAEFARHAAEQLARLEVDLARCRCGLPVGVFGDLGDVVAGVFRRVTIDGVVVENTNYLSHITTPHALVSGREASIRPRYARTEQRPVAMSLLNWIKAWSEFRLRLTLRFLVPAGAGVRVSWGAADGRNPGLRTLAI